MTDILNPVVLMTDYISIGRRIALYRKKAAMTQSVLSEKLGMTESHVARSSADLRRCRFPGCMRLQKFFMWILLCWYLTGQPCHRHRSTRKFLSLSVNGQRIKFRS